MRLHGTRVLESRERGNASVVALIAVVTLLGLTGGMLAVGMRAQGERETAVAEHKALFMANAGVSHMIADLTLDEAQAAKAAGFGSYKTPVDFGGGGYWADLAANGDGTYTVTSTGASNRQFETIEAVLAPTGGGIYDNAIFAGNEDLDPTYTLDLGGWGFQADDINGDIYSGGDVDVVGDASVDGTVRAAGDIYGVPGETGVKQGVPDLASMDYANTADFKVEDLFAGATYQYDDAGGNAWQVPEDNPAHIFRLNPSDRSSDVNSTVKDDYFLEDPYEAVRTDPNQNGKDAYHITLSGGASGNKGPESNQKVFYIDGNLWIHNKKTFSFKFYGPQKEGLQITFVVRGNVYFSDNLFYLNQQKDGVAFIAMEDPNVKDSGNIYFGDPVFGTLEEMNAFMYAENNFYDNNLDKAGSASVTVNGNMTAGNQVLINRDFANQHSKLTVNFDDRIKEGAIEMPALPPMTNGTADSWAVVYWRKTANQ